MKSVTLIESLNMSESNYYKTFSERLSTFQQYNGIPDPCVLATYGFYNIGNEIIKCTNCHLLFISWSPDIHFWKRHKESLCLYSHLDYTYWGDKPNGQDIEKWMQKEHVRDLIKFGWVTPEAIRIILEDFLKLKGDHASIRLLKDYLLYLKYNCKHKYLP